MAMAERLLVALGLAVLVFAFLGPLLGLTI